MSDIKRRWNPWPWAIILSFAIFIGGTVGLVIMACAQKSDLVSANYYEQELKFQTQLDRANRSAQLGADAAIGYDAARQLITISLPPNHAQGRLSGSIDLYRASAAGLDQKVALHLDVKGKQSLNAANLRPGPWQVRVSWSVDGQDYSMDQKLVIAERTPLNRSNR